MYTFVEKEYLLICDYVVLQPISTKDSSGTEQTSEIHMVFC